MYELRVLVLLSRLGAMLLFDLCAGSEKSKNSYNLPHGAKIQRKIHMKELSILRSADIWADITKDCIYHKSVLCNQALVMVFMVLHEAAPIVDDQTLYYYSIKQ